MIRGAWSCVRVPYLWSCAVLKLTSFRAFGLQRVLVKQCFKLERFGFAFQGFHSSGVSSYERKADHIDRKMGKMGQWKITDMNTRQVFKA